MQQPGGFVEGGSSGGGAMAGIDMLMNPKKRLGAGSDAGSGSVVSVSLADDGGGGGEDFFPAFPVPVVGPGDSVSRLGSPSPSPPRSKASSRASSRSSRSDAGSKMESLGLSSAMDSAYNHAAARAAPRISDAEALVMKKELLYQFERLERKGVKLPRKFTTASNLEDMKTEYDRLKRDKEIDASIKM